MSEVITACPLDLSGSTGDLADSLPTAVSSASSSLDLLFGVLSGVAENAKPQSPGVASLSAAPAVVTAVTVLPSANAESVSLAPAKATVSKKSSGSITLAPTLQRDHKGRVIVARFSGGQLCQFRYDAAGALYAFTYARLAWSTADGLRWLARDHHHEYGLEARVTVDSDGSLVLQTAGLIRMLHPNGGITEKQIDGQCKQVRRSQCELSAADLLCVSKIRTDGPVTLPQPQPPAQPPAQSLASGAERITMPIVTAPPKSLIPPAALEARSKQSGNGSVRQDGAPDLAAAVVTSRSGGGHKPDVWRKNVSRLRQMDAGADLKQEPLPETCSSLAEWTASCLLGILTKVKGDKHASLARHLDVLAASAYQQRRLDDARNLHERSLAIKMSCGGDHHAALGTNFLGLARIDHQLGKPHLAEQSYAKAVEIFEKGLAKSRFLMDTGALSANNAVVQLRHYLFCYVEALHALACLYDEQGRGERCGKIYFLAQQAYSAFPGAQSRELETPMKNLSSLALAGKLRSGQGVS